MEEIERKEIRNREKVEMEGRNRARKRMWRCWGETRGGRDGRDGEEK